MTDGENKFGEGVLYDLIESAINSGMYAALSLAKSIKFDGEEKDEEWAMSMVAVHRRETAKRLSAIQGVIDHHIGMKKFDECVRKVTGILDAQELDKILSDSGEEV